MIMKMNKANLLACLIFVMNATANSQNPKSNIDIGVNALMLGRFGNLGNDSNATNPNGFSLQETSINLSANVDAYFKLNAVVAIEQESKQWVANPEEVFVESLDLPHVILKAGKYYPLIGRHNNLHAHDFPFVDAPLPNQMILGDEGVNETGLAAAFLVPAAWYLEIIPQVFSAQNETLFNSSTQDDVAGLLFIKNLWDISDATTFEIDLTYGRGQSNFEGETKLANISTTLKWKKDEEPRDRTLIWTAEYMMSQRDFHAERFTRGFTTWLQWQFAKRWWLQTRAEIAGTPSIEDTDNSTVTRKNSWLFAFVPTEFSALRFQYDNIRAPALPTEERYLMQLNFAIGAHPAHHY